MRLMRAMLPLTRHLPATWLLGFLRKELLTGYTDRELGTHSVERYVKPFGTPDGRDALVEHLQALEPTETTAIAPRLKDLVMPSAIVAGAHDPFVGASVAERLAQDIPRATLDVLPDSRHFLPEESPEALSEVIAKLLARE
jgi:pimeloyl-ACP methyl ester carboxylesterase